MFKDALGSAIEMVFAQIKGWKAVAKDEPNPYKQFLYPIWFLIMISSFIGGWLITEEGTFETGLKNMITEGFIVFVSFHVSSFLLNECIRNKDKSEKDLKRTRIFVAYSSSLIYLIDIIVSLINDFFFLWLFSLYTVYIIYNGAEIFYKVKNTQQKNVFMVVASVLILGMPLILKFFLSLMIKP